MADRPRPSMAPHLQAAEKIGAHGSNSTEEGVEPRDVPVQPDAKNSKAAQRLRQLVSDAMQAAPNLVNAQTFSVISEAIEQHCGYKKKRLCSLIIHGLKFKNPADGLRFHCSDLVTLIELRQAAASTESGGANRLHSRKRTHSEMEDVASTCKAKYSLCASKRSFVLGTVKVLKQQQGEGLVKGQIYEVVKESNSGSSWKTIAQESRKQKVLPKDLEGVLWRWKTPPVYAGEELQISNDGLASNEDLVLSPPLTLSPPRSMDGDAEDGDPLPYPWSQHFSDDGLVYYFNKDSNESQWEKPQLKTEIYSEVELDDDKDSTVGCNLLRQSIYGHVEILADLHSARSERAPKLSVGKIYEVLGEFNKFWLKVIAGYKEDTGNTSIKYLLKSEEGIVWQWTSPSEKTQGPKHQFQKEVSFL